MTPCIAIITPYTLVAIGLKGVLEDMFPSVKVLTFQSLPAFYADRNRPFVHFFVDDSVLLANAGEFDSFKRETIVLCEGTGQAFVEAGFKTIDISLPEKDLVAGILRLHESVHPHTAAMPSHSQQPLVEMLSEREREVLTLMVKGLLNKENADNMNISVTTVIFHRNNICRKFGTRSIGHLAIKAVLAGLVDVNEI